jgi:hypothetical protein
MTQRPVTLFSGYFAFGEAFLPVKIIGILDDPAGHRRYYPFHPKKERYCQGLTCDR